MHKAFRILTMCGAGTAITLAVVLLFAFLPSLSQGPITAQNAWLTNGGFEGTYADWEGSVDRKIAPDWNLWYADASTWPDEAGTIGPPKAYEETSRVHGGDKAQVVAWKDARNFDACLYQQISGITVGHYLRFSAWVYVDTEMGTGDMQTRVGIDPDGGTNPVDIQYETHQSLWDPLTVEGQWRELSVVVKATSPTATAYACTHPRYRMPFYAYWDDANFEVRSEKRTYLPTIDREYCWISPGTLYNPGLEKDFCHVHGYQTPISGYTNVYVAAYWMPFWNDAYNSSTGENAQPEYNYTDRSYRVHSGEVAQQFGLSAWGNYEAGLYQVVTGTYDVSDTLRFAIWGMGWSSSKENEHNELYSDVREGLNFRVGIDPTGGEFYSSTDIVWSDYYQPYDAWQQLEVTKTLTQATTKISVWAYAHPAAHWIKHNETFWDDASLEVIDLQ